MTSTTTATTAAPLPTAAALEAALREALAPTQLEVIDESAAHAGHAGANAEGRGTHFRVRIASPKFEGKPRVARHRLVYDALQVFIAQGLHAIAIEVL
ncbi:MULTISPECIES: BolA family protein [Variovorax]|jgi:BolA family transcriptional regulator, general stress-responsive regulator|uniref:BolA family protein n=1 Tax=Variovorax TaxID=34072 RepID=UPI0008688FAA|nr:MULTISPECIES: BolA family protein [Variovorax]MBN8755998.1 BolA family transcriptional regulator [Variovorax sp.]ODU11888.1 MAG: BolA family transcriptional regulator [Variovorax sp. SCN 67-85]ODV14749.1 MAG: BolA family transcriptional regulator [Variovorax sp. SCN 67-20]OJZ05536.1 MAG: BolA family transcriptional regulator [Variovorax sp. 67-131]UKI05009.1 BolA family transcriptional regulator [Variovorax paradoxus]